MYLIQAVGHAKKYNRNSPCLKKIISYILDHAFCHSEMKVEYFQDNEKGCVLI